MQGGLGGAASKVSLTAYVLIALLENTDNSHVSNVYDSFFTSLL